MITTRNAFLLATTLLLAGCQRGASASDAVVAEAPSPSPPTTPLIVALGDVHGDLASAQEALQLAGATDLEGRWIGGEMVVVQLGDQTDRGDDEREILDWFERLQTDAAAAGGAFHFLLGNHEIMNAQMDMRYVTEGGFEDFEDIQAPADDARFNSVPPHARGRVAAFMPGGTYAIALSDQPVVLVRDRNVFVHGGITPSMARFGVDELNARTAAWLRGEADEPAFLRDQDGPIWHRGFSLDTDAAACETLGETLALLDADRMIVGHTVQQGGITSACDGRVWRVDVGLADHYGGETQVLEIRGDQVRARAMGDGAD